MFQRRVLAVGGLSELGTEPLSSCESLDVDGATLRWSTCASLNDARAFAAVASSEKGVFVFGGTTATNAVCSDTAEQLDVAATKWTVLRGRMKTARNAFGAAVSTGRVFLVGGDGNSGNLNSVELFNTATLSFVESVAPISIARQGLAAVSVSCS